MNNYKIILFCSSFTPDEIPETGINYDFISGKMNQFIPETIFETSNKWEAVNRFSAEYNTGSIENAYDFQTGTDCVTVDFYAVIDTNTGETILKSDF